MIGTMLEAHNAVSEIQPEPEMELTTIPCPDCQGEGVLEYARVTRRFFDPFDSHTASCETCRGEGFIETETCSACGQTETLCCVNTPAVSEAAA